METLKDDIGAVAGQAAAEPLARVAAFYERHPYPPPRDELRNYARAWDDDRRRAEAHLFWPEQPYRDDRAILIAGCGALQAAKYALRWPRSQVVGIDLSGASLAFTEKLKRKYRLANLELRQLPVERAAEIGGSFDQVVCTGVLHHLPDPHAGLAALRQAMAPDGALHLMVYAPYGRAGVYLLQDYCRRLGIGPTSREIADLVASLKALPPDHPLVPLLRNSPDFRDEAGVADALLHPLDRSYSVPQLFDFLDRAGLAFSRWLLQAPYLVECGALASLPHRPRLERLEARDRYAAIELFRGTFVRHSLAARRDDRSDRRAAVSFEGDAWLGYIPVRMAGTIIVRERLPPGASGVMINQGQTFNDLYLPIEARQERLLHAIDGVRSIDAIIADGGENGRELARNFFEQLWRYDLVVFDTSPALGTNPR